MTSQDAETAAAALAYRALDLPELAAAKTVAAYVSMGREPGTRPLLDALRTQGARVLLPVLLPDNDLDWALYEGSGSLRPAGRGLLEPVGPQLGPDAVPDADAVLLPGLAVDGRGMRLGRGGGSYDRVLARIERRPRTPSWWCCSTTTRWSHRCRRNRTTTPWRRRGGDPLRPASAPLHGLSTRVSTVLLSTAALLNDHVSSSPLAHFSVWSV